MSYRFQPHIQIMRLKMIRLKKDTMHLEEMEVKDNNLAKDLNLSVEGRFFKFILEETLQSNRFQIIGYVYGNDRFYVEYQENTKSFGEVLEIA